LFNVRASRNKVLFESTGVHGTAIEVKEYIKSIFGTQSAQYRQLGELRFKNIA
jgi:hypothetical protein